MTMCAAARSRSDKRCQVELPQQVIQEGVVGAVALLEAVLLVRGCNGHRRACGLIDVVPGDIDRQVLGNLFDGPGCVGVVGLECQIGRVLKVAVPVGVAFLPIIDSRRVVDAVERIVLDRQFLVVVDEIQHRIRLDGLADLGLEFEGRIAASTGWPAAIAASWPVAGPCAGQASASSQFEHLAEIDLPDHLVG